MGVKLYFDWTITSTLHYKRDIDGARTVDDSQHSPEQEDDDECQCFFTLYAGDAFDEDEIECE